MNAQDPYVSIVTVNWNNASDTQECIRSLFAINYSHYEIIVVDNGSTTNDVEALESEFGASIVLVKSATNLGFAGGVNVGVECAMSRGAEYVLLINNDTIVQPDFLGLLVDVMARNTRCGMATPKVCFYSEPTVIWSAAGTLSKVRASGFSRGEGSPLSRFSKTESVSFASGCCILIRTAIIPKIGLWDESYFLYVEDADYSYRVIRGGYEIVYVGASVIYHKVNRSTVMVHSLVPLYYTFRNRFIFKDRFGVFYKVAAEAYLWSVLAVKYVLWRMRGQRENWRVVRRAIIDYRKGKVGNAHISKKEFEEMIL